MRVLPWAVFGLVKILLGVFRAALGNLFKNKVQINTLKETVCSISYTSSSAYKGRPTFLTVTIATIGFQ